MSMKFIPAVLAFAALCALWALPARAAPCDGYTRVVTFADGSARLARGTACLASDGQWRVAEEHLLPPSAVAAAPARPQPRVVYYYQSAYYDPAYYYGPYPYPDPFWTPYYPYSGYGWGYGHYYGHHDHHDDHHYHH